MEYFRQESSSADRLDSSRSKPLPQMRLEVSPPSHHLQNTSIVTSDPSTSDPSTTRPFDDPTLRRPDDLLTSFLAGEERINKSRTGADGCRWATKYVSWREWLCCYRLCQESPRISDSNLLVTDSIKSSTFAALSQVQLRFFFRDWRQIR